VVLVGSTVLTDDASLVLVLLTDTAAFRGRSRLPRPLCLDIAFTSSFA